MKGRNRHASWTAERQRDFRSRWRLFAAILMVAPWWWWKARPSDLYLTEYTAMIIFGPLLVIVGIGFYLLAAVHPRCLCAAVFRRSDDRHLGLSHRGRRARRHCRGSCSGRRNLWPWPARARLCAMGVGSAPDHPSLCRARHRRRLQRHAWNRPDGDAFTHLADDLRRHRRDRRQRHGVRPLHRNGRARTSRTGLGAGLTPSRRRPLGRAGSGIPYARRSSSSNAE